MRDPGALRPDRKRVTLAVMLDKVGVAARHLRPLSVSLARVQRQRPLHGPPTANPIGEQCGANAHLLRPSRKRPRPAIVLNKVVGSPVASILLALDPSHVARFVMAVVVDAIKFVSPARPLADVLEKQNGATLTAHPRLMDADAPAPIVVPRLVFWIRASGDGVPNSPILRCRAQTMLSSLTHHSPPPRLLAMLPRQCARSPRAHATLRAMIPDPS